MAQLVPAATTTPPALELLDLREHRDEALLQSLYDGLYTHSFPLAEERESLASVRESLWGDGRDRSPRCHFLVALDGASVLGIAACEYYAHSNCGLLSYIAVQPELRGGGLSRVLLDGCIAALETDAAALSLNAVFAEIHDPAKTPAGRDSIHPLDRVRIMAHLGAKRIPVPYVQPELEPGKGRGRTLMLVAFPHGGRELTTLPTAVVQRFLAELYESLGVEDPADDVDFVRSLLGLTTAGDEIELEELTPVEEPRLSPATVYGVALHLAVERHGSAGPERPSTELQSFEEDILAYAYPEPAPFWTRTVDVDAAVARLGVAFAGEIAFRSEGRLVSLRCADGPHGRERRFLVRAARTEFRSNLSVLHLVLGPDPSDLEASALNEYDLIKLTKLWQPSEQMHDGLDAVDRPYVVFRAGDRTLALGELIKEIFGEDVDPQAPRVGTIQILHEMTRHGLCKEIEDVRQRQGAAEPSDDALALGGIIQGLLDFEEVDADELADVFKEVQLEEELARAFHKRTLIVVSATDRAFEAPAVQLSLGVSPYLLVPHAVLLHNEWWLWRALAELDDTKSEIERLPGFGRGRRQERARREVGQTLAQRLVPNVFGYAEEQNLYATGSQTRGLEKRQAAVQTRLGTLTADIRARHDRIRNAVTKMVPLLLLAFTWIDTWHKYPGEHDVVLGLMIPITILTGAALAFVFWRD